MWLCEGAKRGRFSGFYYSLVRVMSGKAYIRHILSIYSAYIAIRWKAGGKEGKNKGSKDYKDGKVFKGSKEGKVLKVYKVFKVLRDYFYSVSASDTCVRRSRPLS